MASASQAGPRELAPGAGAGSPGPEAAQSPWDGGKEAWRRRLREAWRAWSRTERGPVSAAICTRLQALLLGQEPWPAAGAGGALRRPALAALMLYAPLATEVDVTPLLTWARRQGLAVLLPRVDPARQVMEARQVSSWDDTEVGPWGLRQPRARCPAQPVDGSTLIVVPGLGFDRQGWRLGRGGGFYDRFLDRHPAAWRAGVVPSAMLLASVPRDEHDRRMDLVVSEAGVLGPWWGIR
ncbi:5-formyltetrahydrofolate cyclo-ligase [Thermaerobacter subterraneus]|uniref:5-formyltetrahydrofolate cyclo-ligase n=1 Tax=Thermaerobacter subterraneus DSM 13965 TaxID=867903 RepID=K6Q3P2_9FIRM|nr:5-formyltetrahydrofolate cyclo-ligase [Thermaerobacter subterraneus]EKP95908.1 5,10-methenyltetrahydrofolate synthetase [Thermaerobacter subterraneus DSM 13965]